MRHNTLIEQALAEHEQRRRASTSTGEEREAEATIGGDSVAIAESETTQTLSDTFLSASGNVKGVPRGREASEAREIARTEGMQIFVNAIVDQLLGGELTFSDTRDDIPDAAADLKAILRDVIEGPHLHGADLDDLIAAAVDDMVGPGEAFWEALPPSQGAEDLPVVALTPIDPLTMRRNVDKHGNPQDPPWIQAPIRSSGGTPLDVGSVSTTELEQDDVIVLSWPGSFRSDRIYPYSPAMQVKRWLELLADSTTHHSRYYSDNELPPGLVSVREATQQDIDNIRDEIQKAKGDPRAAPVVGSDARWVEVGGSAVDLSVVEEQSWFIELCGAALGVPKTELSMDDEINYSTSATEERVINKRVTRPLAKQVGQALTRQLLTQFPAYQALERPFDAELRRTSPAQERAMQDHYIDQFQAGATTYGELFQKLGREYEEEDTTVEIGGETIDYSQYPKPVLEAKLADARNAGADDSPDPDDVE